jgi:AcrR family transcriptional regulator
VARTGRRPGPSTTRDEILRAARELFASRGYDGTTTRLVAEAAQVDPALVARAFGNKDGLFRAAVAWPFEPAERLPPVVDGPRSRVGHRLARLFVDTWEDPEQRAPIIALLRSATDHEDARALLSTFVARQILVPVAVSIGADEPELRAEYIAAYFIGLGLARYVLRFEPLASDDREHVADVTGKVVQRFLTGAL